MPSFYPIHLDIRGKKCLVVGGGTIAQRKVITLLRFGGKVVVVSPEATAMVEKLSLCKKIIWHKRRYRASDLRGAFLVFAATDSEERNRAIGSEAHKKGILVNVVDSPRDCCFISPALVVRGHLVMSVSTEGMAPLLAKKIREELEERYDKAYRRYTDLMVKARKRVITDGTLSMRDRTNQLKRLASLSGKQVTLRNIIRCLRTGRGLT